MTNHDLTLVLQGALAACAVIAALFFVRFWRVSRDRLFAFFAVAFALLGANWLAVATLEWGPETRHQAYLLRLLAFILIIVGVIDKNRRARRDGGA